LSAYSHDAVQANHEKVNVKYKAIALQA